MNEINPINFNYEIYSMKNEKEILIQLKCYWLFLIKKWNLTHLEIEIGISQTSFFCYKTFILVTDI